ncbi:LysR family transcriptional regulator [Roseomonas sp. GC11]|uniref:LysR family transcriptional regulator n=1 Tax=Roseomonas sp. GC11 TaxID=2950546 RepID=UPI00210D7E55|nr:LysR family transcriptional regulator [Roseomonas sp. GC11]MCQ4159853.1 LysR family transcriptional regulator [Roseomonas sp. GC11]
MDPRKLLYLACVIEQGSFKKAARHLLISQPALSTSMDRLERDLGKKLLKRSPTGVTPTPIGELLYAHARLIREELVLAERCVSGGAASPEGTIHAGVLPSLAVTIIPRAVTLWQAENQDATLRLAEKNQLDLLLGLMRGEFDFIVAQTEFYGFLEGLKQRVLFRDRLHVIARPGHPASDAQPLTWSTLVRYPWILQMVGKQRTLLERLLQPEGLDLPGKLTECSSANCIKAMVAGSDSLATLPASAIGADVREGRIQALDMADPLLNRDIAVIFREGSVLPAAARGLVAQIAAAGAAMSDDAGTPAQAGEARHGTAPPPSAAIVAHHHPAGRC